LRWRCLGLALALYNSAGAPALARALVRAAAVALPLALGALALAQRRRLHRLRRCLGAARMCASLRSEIAERVANLEAETHSGIPKPKF
jgi:hypothetical protein